MGASIAARKCAPEKLGAVLVLGLGVSGKEVARYCAELLGTRADRLFIAAGAPTDDSKAFVSSLACDGVSWAFGDSALEGLKDSFDVCIASPGIPYWHELYRAGVKLSRELISEVEFSWRESAATSTWVAITGTNGKTTTTALTAHVLKGCGFAANAVGNIGDVCLKAVHEAKTDVYVAEVSSYQLYSTARFAPDIAVELNITPDHIHWHRTLEAYRDAKFKVLDNMAHADTGTTREGRIAVLDATNDVVRAKVRELRQQDASERGFAYVPLGTADGIGGDMRARCGAENAAFITEEGQLVVALDGREHALANVSDLKLKGAHNASNALAAATVAVCMGADDAAIAKALAGFAPLEHRIEPCGEVGGVECFNDSKATNVDATVKALEAFGSQRIVVLLGGQDKGTELAELAEAVGRCAAGAVCFGEGGPRIADALEETAATTGLSLVRAGKMEEALDEALSLAQPGDAVLLSPACASFDEFSSFEHRGRVFKQLVADRAGQ